MTRDSGEPHGLLFDIQGHSVHDGPGCRTAVFLSGCPLECFWCCNPEGRRHGPQLVRRDAACVCGQLRCLEACPSAAISKGPAGRPVFDRPVCGRCSTFECVKACFNGVLSVAGREYSLSELLRVLNRDRFYWGPGGGVTFTGGEPLAQPEFLLAALEACRELYIHAALETSAFVARELFLRALALADFVFVDLKHLDDACHRAGTGVSNQLILDNLRAAAALPERPRIVIRLPLVPGFNDSAANLAATAAFLLELHLQEINLLPLHRLAASKYANLALEYRVTAAAIPGPDELQAAAKVFRAVGLRCFVGHETPF